MANLVTTAVEAIYQMDNDEINQVVEATKLKRTHLSRQAVRNFVKGDMVQFTSSRTGGKVNATVEKVNRKYVVVQAHVGGQKWRVPATHLTHLKEIA